MAVSAASPAGPAARIAPSMLSSDFARLADEARRMLEAGADWLHMDVMVRLSVHARKSTFTSLLSLNSRFPPIVSVWGSRVEGH